MKEQVKLRRRLHLAAAAAAEEEADPDPVANEQPRPSVIVKKFEINLPGNLSINSHSVH